MVTLCALALAATAATGGQTVLLDFYSDYCGPCRQMAPTVARLEAAGYPVQKINVSQQPQMASQYEVRGVPCFVLVHNGQVVDRVVGATSHDRLLQMYQRADFTPGQTSPAGAVAPTPPREPAEKGIPFPPAREPAQDFDVANRDETPPARSRTPRQDDDLVSPADRAMAASVRLKIDEGGSQSYGSGTVVDLQDDEALVLTCGHIFRDSSPGSRVEVDFFPQGQRHTAQGQIVGYDMKRDVGLVAVRPGIPIAAMKVAGPGYRASRGQRVFSIGCDRGAPPSLRESRVTAINKYLGPANVEVAGAPIDGRSGGGLFTADGTLIGVCNAADPQDDEGLYAALESIHAELTAANLSFVYTPGREELPLEEPNYGATASRPEQLPRTTPALASADARSPVPVPVARAGGDASRLKSLLDRGEAEVICIVRPRVGHQGQSHMIVFDRPSPELLSLIATAEQESDQRVSPALQVADGNEVHRPAALVPLPDLYDGLPSPLRRE